MTKTHRVQLSTHVAEERRREATGKQLLRNYRQTLAVKNAEKCVCLSVGVISKIAKVKGNLKLLLYTSKK